MKTRISGKEAARVAEDMAKPGPVRVVAASEAQEAPGALVPSPGSELDRKGPPRVRKLLPRNDQWKAPTPDLEGSNDWTSFKRSSESRMNRDKQLVGCALARLIL
jgi:hypothetical protein